MIVSKGPKVFSEDDLTKAGYPRNPSKEDSESKNYLVIEIEPVVDVELKDTRWDFKKLKNYKRGNASALPFTASLAELMRNKVE